MENKDMSYEDLIDQDLLDIFEDDQLIYLLGGKDSIVDLNMINEDQIID
jgi:hypothetical protein